ncbi:MAG: GNAT family acetyltransferase [Planctomycetota bacterium]|nr:MAG: GNAT family acetyltransferase [Planctomycetota bacterium]
MGKPQGDQAESKNQNIVGFHQDDEQHWVADLACGHFQHVRHHPPLFEREWVLQESGRIEHLGTALPCKKCVLGAPKDE